MSIKKQSTIDRITDKKQLKQAGFKFCNRTHVEMAICLSHPLLDEFLNFRSSEDVSVFERVIRLDHETKTSVSSKPFKFFEKSKQIYKDLEKSGGSSSFIFDDFVEDDPVMIDIKI
jgi:hypothetical protein